MHISISNDKCKRMLKNRCASAQSEMNKIHGVNIFLFLHYISRLFSGFYTKNLDVYKTFFSTSTVPVSLCLYAEELCIIFASSK